MIVFFSQELNTAVKVKVLVKFKGIQVGFTKVPIDDRLSGKWIQIVPDDLYSSLLSHGWVIFIPILFLIELRHSFDSRSLWVPEYITEGA